jgi:capsid protein
VLEQARAQGKVLSVEEINTLTSAAEKYSTAVPGQFDTLPTGYDFTPFESKWPDISAEGHIKSHVRAWSAARGVSFHTLGNDLSDVNYSSAQVGIQDERKHFKVIQGWLTSWLHQDVAAQVIRHAMLFEHGLKPSKLDSYLAAINWQPPTWRPIDPLKAANADDVALRNRSTSRRRIWLSQGLDPDDMEAEILAEEKRLGPIEPARAPTSSDLAGAASG